MKRGILWKLILIASTVVISAVFFLPNTPLFQFMPGWWKTSMPDRGIVLGLDLQGGSYLVYEVEGDKAVDIIIERVVSSLNRVFERKKIQANAKKDGLFVVVAPADIDADNVVKDTFPALTIVETGDALIYKLPEGEITKIKDMATDQALEIIRNRIDQFGVTEPVIYRQAENEIVVQLPGIGDPRRAMELIGRTALLEFKLVDDESPLAMELPASILPGEEAQLIEEFGDKIPEGRKILFQRTVVGEAGMVTLSPFLLKDEALLTGDLLVEARVNIDEMFREPQVSIRFNPEGAEIFEKITSENVQKRLAIILDGNVYSAPVIQERIAGGEAQITGRFLMEEARDLAIALRAGSLPAPVKMLQNVTVGPSLGMDSIEAGKRAMVIGAIFVVAFMIFYYRLSGVIATAALLLNMVLLVGALASLNATLTLPGIAGIILAIGIAVDTNIIMFERMREELRAGKTPKAAIESGYRKAILTILDSNITILIACAVLFQFGTGPIKGFAATLGIAVAINLFAAVMGTKTIFDIVYSKREVKELGI